MEYFAFGETFIEEHKNSNNSPYKFNGKELDEESGLYYYGARYYDPRISIWASVDPLAEKFAGRSSYEYCFSNPVNLIDPTGMGPDGWGKKGNKWIYKDEITKDNYKSLGYSDFSDGNTNNTYKSANNSTVTLKPGGMWTESSFFQGSSKTTPLLFNSKKYSNKLYESKGSLYNGSYNSTDENHSNTGGFNFGNANAYYSSGTLDGGGTDFGVSASVATWNFDNRIGTKNYNFHTSTSGVLGGVEANLNAGFLTGQRNKMGGLLDANIGAYAAKVEYSMGAKLWIFQVDSSVTASVYSAHAGVTYGGYYDGNTNSLILKLGEHAGFGLGEGASTTITIDLNYFKSSKK